jgi:hypothetical protein
VTAIDWHIAGADLNSRRRRGGANAQEGSEYQRTYALMLACQMLNEPKKTLAIRWEGAQDIDLKLCDGTDLYIQTMYWSTYFGHFDRLL